MPKEATSIPYDSMKLQLEQAIGSYVESSSQNEVIEMPSITFEKGATQITFPIPSFTHEFVTSFIAIVKQYIENVRLYSFEDGHYALQALNKNLYDTEGISENIKFELFNLLTAKVEISKSGNLSQEEINATIALFKANYSSLGDDPRNRLIKMGASVLEGEETLTWDYIGGYDEVKRNIQDTIILPLKKPEVYDQIAEMTRKSFESNRPRAVLFEGSPGVGKTTAARVIAGEVNIPLIYVPIESIMSKWYGKSSQNLSDIFEACEEMGGAIIFLDEIDSLATSRDQNMFEATRRLLSVLLRKLDGIEAAKNTITIGATNRKGDLDHALLSRFDQSILFPLPNADERALIFQNYAKHLTEEEIQDLGKLGENLSGRNIKDICESAERHWARKVIAKKLELTPPQVDYYKHSINRWNKQS